MFKNPFKPAVIAEPEPEEIEQGVEQPLPARQFARTPLQRPRRVTLTTLQTQTIREDFIPDAWHIGTPNGEYIYVSQSDGIDTNACWQLGRGGFVLMPGVNNTITLYNSGTDSAQVVVTPVSARFDYDPGWGF